MVCGLWSVMVRKDGADESAREAIFCENVNAHVIGLLYRVDIKTTYCLFEISIFIAESFAD